MNFLDCEECLLIVLIGVLECDVDHDTLWTELNVKDACVVEGQEPGLLGYPKCNIRRLEVDSIDPKAHTSVILGSI